MDAVERIKEICKEKKIAISKLEKDCGCANGYIRSLREGKLPSDRLFRIAEYLEVDPKYLALGESSKYYYDDETAEKAQELFDTPGLRVLFDAARDSKPEDLQMAADLLKRLKETNPDA